jgi:hypothetical protein
MKCQQKSWTGFIVDLGLNELRRFFLPIALTVVSTQPAAKTGDAEARLAWLFENGKGKICLSVGNAREKYLQTHRRDLFFACRDRVR